MKNRLLSNHYYNQTSTLGLITLFVLMQLTNVTDTDRQTDSV